MRLRVLSVAYPLAPVGPDAAGGAEQVLTMLDERLVREGHESVVIACEASRTAGTLVAIPREPGCIDDGVRARAHNAVRRAMEEALARRDFDFVHLHGVDFYEYLPPEGPAVLVTLHLPPEWYPARVFEIPRPRTWLHCVSASQERRCPASPVLLPYVENGVALERLGARVTKRRFAAALGRICPEKGFHIAAEAARMAGIPLAIAGEVFPYEAHERYFRNQLEPLLDGGRRFIGPVGAARKRRLLAAARCLLAPSLAPETSSLVAMEAMACGTPVIAFPAGALAEIVEHGRTGYLVNDAREMAEAIGAVDAIDPEACRRAARRRFDADRMFREYAAIYGGVRCALRS